jgi:hypothetical protein
VKLPIMRCWVETLPRRKGISLLAIFCRSWCGVYLAPPKDCCFFGAMALDELADLVDDGDGIQIRFALRAAPGKEAMAAEYDTVAARHLLDRALEHHGQFKARTLPRDPHHLVAELLVELVHLFLAVGRSSECDSPVGMEMIHVRKGKKSMQRGIDRGGDGIVAEGAERIHADDLVFQFDATINLASASTLSRYKVAKPSTLMLPRSPPLPFTQSTVFFCPSSGSVSSSFELVLPPPKLVMRRSDPSKLER